MICVICLEKVRRYSDHKCLSYFKYTGGAFFNPTIDGICFDSTIHVNSGLIQLYSNEMLSIYKLVYNTWHLIHEK